MLQIFSLQHNPAKVLLLLKYSQKQRIVSQQKQQNIWQNMSIQDTMLCGFSSYKKRFGTVYYFLKPNNHGEGGIQTES